MQAIEQPAWTPESTETYAIGEGIRIAHGMFERAVQRGRSDRQGNSYSAQYGEPPSAAKTSLADFFNILLEGEKEGAQG